jgi:hypothetical protein
MGQGPVGQAPPAAGYQEPNQSPYQGPYQSPYQGPNQGTGFQQPPYQATYQGPYTGQAAGPGDPTQAPPVPPGGWRRKEPIGAIVLIGLGSLFLLGQLDIFSGRVLEFTWPVLLIGLGVWLIIRRLGESQGGTK